MSNFESASPRNDLQTNAAVAGFFPPQISQFAHHPPPLHEHDQQPPPQPPPPPPSSSKKRSLPGNPDPDAEVIALSPKSLQATNRFLCEICNKGFQRDQNLQLHRRGHNLPWKLKQRPKGEVVKKKVYICPEPSCVHHHPSRALGDLTGIKKHFFRKHGEKKWKCDKCTKRYAVQSDWKAHAKVCGTREYKCDCGTIFSRRDSFVTHRAFCDALAQETSRPINGFGSTNALLNPQLYNHQNYSGTGISIKREQLQDHHHHHQQQQQQPLHLFSPAQLELFFSGGLDPTFPNHQTRSYTDPKHDFQTSSVDVSASNTPCHMSATALLQRAAQMGPTMSQPMNYQGSSGLAFPSASEDAISMSGGGNGYFAHGNNNGHPMMMRDPMMTSAVSTMMSSSLLGPSGLEGLSYSNDLPNFDHEGLVGGMFMNNTQNMNENEDTTATTSRGMNNPVESTEQLSAKRKRSEGMTRDFLGLKDASGFDLMRNSSTSSDHVMMSNNGGQQQQVMKDNRNQNNDQYTYFGRVE